MTQVISIRNVSKVIPSVPVNITDNLSGSMCGLGKFDEPRPLLEIQDRIVVAPTDCDQTLEGRTQGQIPRGVY